MVEDLSERRERKAYSSNIRRNFCPHLGGWQRNRHGGHLHSPPRIT